MASERRATAKRVEESEVEQSISGEVADLRSHLAMSAMSVPSGAGATRLVEALVSSSAGRVKRTSASPSIHASLQALCAAVAPSLFARQTQFVFDCETVCTVPVDIAPAKILHYLAGALNHWVAHAPSGPGNSVLIVDDAHVIPSRTLTERFLSEFIKARANLPVSLLLLGNDTFRLPRSPAEICSDHRTELRIGTMRKQFRIFYSLKPQDISDKDIEIMISRLGGSPDYGRLACHLRRNRLFSPDYYSLARLIELGQQVGGARQITDGHVDAYLALPRSRFSVESLWI